MKKIILILMMLFIIGCGGGSGNPVIPPAPDFSGLEGTWTGEITIAGNIDYTAARGNPAHTVYESHTAPIEWIITKDSINGVGIVKVKGGAFTYDGSILTFKWENSSVSWDKTSSIHNVGEWSMPLYRTSTSGVITGTLKETWEKDQYGSSYGVLAISGEIWR